MTTNPRETPNLVPSTPFKQLFSTSIIDPSMGRPSLFDASPAIPFSPYRTPMVPTQTPAPLRNDGRASITLKAASPFNFPSQIGFEIPPTPFQLNPIMTPRPEEESFVLGAPVVPLPRAVDIVNGISTIHSNKPDQEKVVVNHISNSNITVELTARRQGRILKRRAGRVKFLKRNPQLSLPYKFREHGPLHVSRSTVAKNRRRNNKGKFELEMDFTLNSNALTQIEETESTHEIEA